MKPHDDDNADDGKNSHFVWQAQCFNLGMVFGNAGDIHSAKTLYNWYLAQDIIAMKRHHGTANEVRQAAAQHRKGETGRYGFGKGKSAHPSAAGDDDDKGKKGSKGQSQKGQKGGKSGKGGKKR